MDSISNAKVIVAAIAVIAVCAVLVSMDPVDEPGRDAYIVHTGDTDANVDGPIGFDGVAALRDDLSERGPVFMFDTGDCMQGTGMTMLTKGASSVEILNSVGYDAVCPGYHDLTYGISTYLDRAGDLDCAVVCANMVSVGTGEPILDEYAVIEKEGLKVGVFGLMSPYIEDLERPDFLKQIRVDDPLPVAERIVGELEKKGVDLIVALGHFGQEGGYESTAEYLCNSVKGIDVFLDGNNDGPGSISKRAGDTLLANTVPNFGEAGVIKLTGKAVSSKVSSYSGSSQAVADTIKMVQDRTDEQLNKVVGHSQILIDGADRQSFFGESPVGDLTADSFRHSTGADIGMLNGGSIRASIQPGDITIGDVCRALPFDNYVMTKEVTGRLLLEIMEQGLSQYPAQNGGFPQFSGMSVVWDPDAQPYHRVVSITVGGEPLDQEKVYTVAGSEYMMVGGDGYSMLVDVPVKKSHGMIYETLCGYLTYLKDVTEVSGGRLAEN